MGRIGKSNQNSSPSTVVRPVWRSVEKQVLLGTKLRIFNTNVMYSLSRSLESDEEHITGTL